MSLEVAIVFLAILSLMNYCFRQSVVYPPFIFCGMWPLRLVKLLSDLTEVEPANDMHSQFWQMEQLGLILGGLLIGLVPLEKFGTHLYPPLPKDR
jgi:hypothetical protein